MLITIKFNINKPTLLANGDTVKQLLARSRYLLFKSSDKWTSNQKEESQYVN